MKSRIAVHKWNGSEKYSLVRSATEMAAEIDRVIAARERAIMDEAREVFGASMPEDMAEDARPKTLEDARRILIMQRRACLTQGLQDRHYYLVFDFELQKRSQYYAFSDWATSYEGHWFLWKMDCRTGWWNQIPRESYAGRFVIPRQAKTVFKTYCDHTFGGQIWIDVLNQVGGCPAEFVDAWSVVINQRLRVAF